jgi:hypothetical protein
VNRYDALVASLWLKNVLRNALRYGGAVLFLAGTICLPWPVVSPAAITTIFPSLAAQGFLVNYGITAMTIGAAFFAASFLIRKPMPLLLIRCPVADRAVSIGFAMDKKLFASSSLSNQSVTCTVCKKQHIWSKADVLPESFNQR